MSKYNQRSVPESMVLFKDSEQYFEGNAQLKRKVAEARIQPFRSRLDAGERIPVRRIEVNGMFSRFEEIERRDDARKLNARQATPIIRDRAATANLYNPYGFVYQGPRPGKSDGKPKDDIMPRGHHRFHQGHYTGRIELDIQVVTPLALLDASTRTPQDKKQHGTYDVHMVGGRAMIPETSIKGMLSSALEVITNSRFRVCDEEKWANKLSYHPPGWPLPPAQEFPCAPKLLLHSSLFPPHDLTECSAADRAFGMVSGESCYAGHLRIVSHPSTEAVLEKGRTIQVLGEAKPAQARFYTLDQSGAALHHKPKSSLYKADHQLAGRKHYLHHRDFRVENIVSEHAGRQNRTYHTWVAASSRFSVTLYLDDVDPLLVGALLWLVNAPSHESRGYLKLGGARPLGLGAVAITLREARIEDASGRYARVPQLEAPCALDEARIANLIKNYQDGLSEHSGIEFSDLPFIQGFRAACEGREGVGYPRLTANGDIFRWFSTNENGQQVALQPLHQVNALPRNPR